MRRPDFLDGLGLFVGPTDCTLAVVSKRLFQVRLRETAVTALPPPHEAARRRQVLVGAIAEFVRAQRLETAPAVLCVPRAEAAVSRVLLPAAAQENLAQVLEYEMENLVPLPRDEVFYDYSMRPLGEERIEVLLVCVPRAVIHGHLDALEEAGVRPRGIVLCSTAMAGYVGFCRGATPGAMGLLLATPEATEIALLAGGRLVASQLLPAPGARADLIERSLARQMADELLDPEQTALYRWSLADGVDGLPAIGEGDLPALAREALHAGDAFGAAAPTVLPAVGAALAAVREGAVAPNLLPAEKREALDEGPSSATWVLLATSFVLFLAWGVSAIVKDAMLRHEVQTRLEEVAPEVREVKAMQSEVDDLQRQIDVLAPAQDGRVTTLLKDLTELIPADAYLTSLSLNGNSLRLDGQARAASDLITALEKSKRFKNVSFASPTTRQGDKERFTIQAEVVK